MANTGHNLAIGKNKLLELLPRPLALLLRRSAHYCSLATTAAMASIFNQLPSKRIQRDAFFALLPNSLHVLCLSDVNSTANVLARAVQMKAFVIVWGMPTFYRFNIYDNQSNEKLIPQC